MTSTKTFNANAQSISIQTSTRDVSINVSGVFVATLTVTVLKQGKNGNVAVPHPVIKPDASLSQNITAVGDYTVEGLQPGDTVTVSTTAYTSGAAQVVITTF
jgi:hypothetical protein